MSSQKALIRICLQEKAEVFLTSEYEPEKNLTLKILDIKHNESYVGQASSFELRNQAARIRLTFSDFIKETKKALFQTPLSGGSYIYSLEKDGEDYTLKWKSIDQEETIINLGSVQMRKQDHTFVLNEVLMGFTKEIVELNSKIEKCDVDLKKYKTQTANALKQLSEVIDVNENLQKELFAKFVLVLNEKKKLIETKSHNKLSKTINIHKASKSKKIQLLSDSSEEEIDEFLDLNEPGPSTSTKRNSSLFLDDEDESVVPVRPSKMRNRKAGIRRTSGDQVTKSEIKSELSKDNEDDSDDFLLNNL